MQIFGHDLLHDPLKAQTKRCDLSTHLHLCLCFARDGYSVLRRLDVSSDNAVKNRSAEKQVEDVLDRVPMQTSLRCLIVVYLQLVVCIHKNTGPYLQL